MEILVATAEQRGRRRTGRPTHAAAGPLDYPDPELADTTVRLRRWRESDVDCVRLAATDPSIPTGTTVPAVYTPEAARAFVHRQWSRLEAGEGLSLAMADPTTDEALGLLALLRQPEPRVLNVGYWVVPTARRRGLAGAAVRLATDWALAATDTELVRARVHPDNVASLRTLTGAGFDRDQMRGQRSSTPGSPST